MGSLRDDGGSGLKFQATVVAKPLAEYDLVVVPGGGSTREWIINRSFMDWIATVATSKIIASVCTGALLLGAAGLLEGQVATTHPNAFHLLKPYCAAVVDQRLVESGNVITAQGVSASMDLGLYLCEKFTNRDTRLKIQRQMDYLAYPSTW